LISVDPPRIAGPGTFVDELITAAGGRNAFDDARALWPEVSLEEVVRRQPDVVVVATGGADARTLARFETAPGWRDLRAVRAGRARPWARSCCSRCLRWWHWWLLSPSARPGFRCAKSSPRSPARAMTPHARSCATCACPARCSPR